MSAQAIASFSGPEIRATIPILPHWDQFTADARQESASLRSTAYKSNQYSNKEKSTRDSTLSSMEEYVFALMHPGESSSLDIYMQYDAKGNLRINTRGMPRLINIKV